MTTVNRDKFNKRLLWLLAPLITLCLQGLRVKPIEDWIMENHSATIPYLIGFTLLGTFITFLLSAFNPVLKYERLAKKRWNAIAGDAAIIIEEYKALKPCMNIMIPRRRFFYFVEPCKKNKARTKFTFTGKIFDISWQSSNSNLSIRITTNQGLCGEVYRNLHPRPIGMLHDRKRYEKIFNFTEGQYGKLEGVKMVFSCPVMAEESHDSTKSRCIAIINFESCEKISQKYAKKDSDEWKALEASLLGLSKLCAKLID